MIRYTLEPEYTLSTETWNAGSGVISFNYLQQREPEPVEPEEPPIITDIWNITDGGFRG